MNACTCWKPSQIRSIQGAGRSLAAESPPLGILGKEELWKCFSCCKNCSSAPGTSWGITAQLTVQPWDGNTCMPCKVGKEKNSQFSSVSLQLCCQLPDENR
ncbi:hypothetical protein DV515_00011587, partial [Chloebia gouldiae]